jgi:hypothetical protein
MLQLLLLLNLVDHFCSRNCSFNASRLLFNSGNSGLGLCVVLDLLLD